MSENKYKPTSAYKKQDKCLPSASVDEAVSIAVVVSVGKVVPKSRTKEPLPEE
jgi:hypothetical protein